MENNVEYGLSNVHYAPYSIVNGTVTFEAPIPFLGAVSMVSKPKGELTETYADNQLSSMSSTNQGYEIILKTFQIPQQFAVRMLGEEWDENDGVLSELAVAQSQSFALLWQMEGDVQATRYVMFNCRAKRAKTSMTTNTSHTAAAINELTILAKPISINGKMLVKMKTTPSTTPFIYDNWFASVYQKSTP